MYKKVDSYRFTSSFTNRTVKSWIKREPAREIPWTPLTKPLNACTVAIISTAAVALKTDKPFDQQGERDNPWWGDPTYRTVPHTATEKDVNVYHLHIETSFAEQDLNCIFPLQRLLALEEAGEIGRSAPTHYSFMGYILDTQELIGETTPAIIKQLQAEAVDVVLLIPV